jgi:hypothetical protein
VLEVGVVLRKRAFYLLVNKQRLVVLTLALCDLLDALVDHFCGTVADKVSVVAVGLRMGAYRNAANT